MAWGNQPARALTDSVEAARLLQLELASTSDLSRRIELMASAIKGRIAFSTSLGIEDQAILHAIAESGAPIDVFTLDTGRLFAETVDTIAESEARYGIKIASSHRKRARWRPLSHAMACSASATPSRRAKPAVMCARSCR